MSRLLLRDTCQLAAEIIDGQHDADLDSIYQAVASRKKMMFRPGAKVRLVGTRNVELDGQIGTVIKANPKRIAVSIPDGREFNVPVGMLEIVGG